MLSESRHDARTCRVARKICWCRMIMPSCVMVTAAGADHAADDSVLLDGHNAASSLHV